MTPERIREIRDYTAGVLAARRAYYEDGLAYATADDYQRRIEASQKTLRYRARKKETDDEPRR
jgi:hypothetical protein